MVVSFRGIGWYRPATAGSSVVAPQLGGMTSMIELLDLVRLSIYN
jgi:hypothetical protein